MPLQASLLAVPSSSSLLGFAGTAPPLTPPPARRHTRMERDISYNAWLKAHHKEWSEGCICQVCLAISTEDRPKLRQLWFTWRAANQLPAMPPDKLLQLELELNPEKTNWGMF